MTDEKPSWWRKLLHETWFKVGGLVIAPAVVWVLWLVWTSLIAMSLPDDVAYADDIAPLSEADMAILAALAEFSAKEQERHELWLCDEKGEELEGYYTRQEAGEELTEREKDRMQTLKGQMGETGLKCARFED